MIEKCCDLHTHSCFSDGSETPEALVKRAEKLGISALALSDHNTVSGLPRFAKAGENSSVITVPGIEFTTGFENSELHIVAMFLKRECWGEIADFTEERCRLKEESNSLCVEGLRGAGYNIAPYEEIKKKYPDASINRVHICRELMNAGYIGSISEGFAELVSENGRFYRPTPRLPALKTIAAIRDWGAVSVFAHPPLSIDREGMNRFIPLAKDVGLNGIELKYSTYDSETERYMTALCESFGLLKSGGSDFHGKNKPDIELGSGKGSLFVPFEYYEKLKESLE